MSDLDRTYTLVFDGRVGGRLCAARAVACRRAPSRAMTREIATGQRFRHLRHASCAAIGIRPWPAASPWERRILTLFCRRSTAAILLLGTAALPVVAAAAPAAAPPPAPFGFVKLLNDHAVVQRDRPLAIRGHAAAGAMVRVTFDGRSAAARADASGRWRAVLPPHPAGGPYTLSATTAGATARIQDVMVGDVYLCGGQSNMEFPARQSTGAWGGLVTAPDPQLRFATIAKASEAAPRDDLAEPAPWKLVAPDTVGEASAVCFYMARALQQREHVPIGFVASDWGGTTIQGWIGGAALATVPGYAADVARVVRLGRDPAGAMAAEEERQEAWWDAHDPAAAAQRAWIAPDFDDGDWPATVPTGSWKDAGVAALRDFDGVVWWRTHVTLTAAQAAAAERLLLGPIDTYDTAWVNGHRVGGAGTAWLGRDYHVSAGTFHAGVNTLALRVLSGGSGGGLTGSPDGRAVVTRSGERIALAPAWHYHLGMRATGLAQPVAPWVVPNSFTTLYNGMIAPIADYGWKLAAWYQGESNTGAAREYATLLPLLMRDWRRATGQPALPFLIAQLSAYGPPPVTPGESGWAMLRDIQAKTARADGHAGLAVTIDVGDRYDIHPTEKRVVGERLARAARAVAYGEAIADGGPEAIDARRRGRDVVIRVRNATGGLRTYGSDVAIGFEACSPRGCRYIAARASGDTVILPAVAPDETRIRYAWADAPNVNLYSGDDLPMVPFEIPVF